MSHAQIDQATESDAEEIARLINSAFTVESWFVDGDRTSPPEIRRLMLGTGGAFFVTRERGSLTGCVYVEHRAEGRGYIGLLAVAASAARSGLGSALLNSAEGRLARLGCNEIDITVVDLRTDLFAFYERRGYRSVGALLPFPRPAKQACHLVTMTKILPR